MATITGLTAERMLEIEAASVVDGDVVGNDLILARQDGSIINAGNVRGPVGPEGPMGSALEVITAQQLFDVGVANQWRAGRQLTPADFTNMGLDAPAGLWNLSNANDSSGNARHLTIKGALPFGVGINGLASTAAVFAGSTSQALYRADTGAADPFRLRTHSIGCWFRSAKSGVSQYIITKRASGARMWEMYVDSGGKVYHTVGNSPAASCIGQVQVCDDRWHFLVATYDGSIIRIYVDGVLDVAVQTTVGPIPVTAAPFNLGGGDADASTATSLPVYGRIDEAFITADILSDEQVKNLYCTKIAHGLGSVPSDVKVAVHRKRRGAPLASVDFPFQPVRLHNFEGVYTDLGAGNVPMAVQGGLTLAFVPGADGRPNGAVAFPGTAGYYMLASDAGLPSGLGSRSFGMWVKFHSGTTMAPIGIGTAGAHHRWYNWSGGFVSESGGDAMSIAGLHDGQWYHIVEVCDNSASDGVKRKLYINGRVQVTSTVLNSLTLAGASGYKLGADHTAALPFNGVIDAPFIFAGVLTGDQVRALYNKSSQQLAPNPKDSTEHVEAMSATDILAQFSRLEAPDLFSLAVMA